MKKNIIPLLLIAFVIAVAATGLFYGLVVSRAPAAVDPASIPGAAEKAGPALGIPPGMRAISVQVVGSSGVLALLQRGDHVDIQAVHSLDKDSELQLRTVLENIEVLGVPAHPDSGTGKAPPPVVTLLANPQEADILGLADSAARIRLLLRNPKDGVKLGRSSIGMTSVMSGKSAASQ
ncbi:MAG: Flp pilus assembly protein CpaB [Acidobacteriia bacterium]|nr:Flp pilus assembly protein CpaB [Terriglobia bacterium]